MLMIKKNQRGNATPVKNPSLFAGMNNNNKKKMQTQLQNSKLGQNDDVRAGDPIAGSASL